MGGGQALYAIADTHLGTRDPRPHGLIDQPEAVADFFHWLGGVPEEGLKLSAWVNHSVVMRRLQPASHLILLGDIFQHRPLRDIATLSQYLQVTKDLESVDATKVLVLGEHEIGFPELIDALALTGCEISGEIYPSVTEEGDVYPLQIGRRSYIFIHGHQFQSLLWQATYLKLPAYVRRFGAKLGNWAWLFSTSTLIGVFLQWLFSPSIWGWVGVAFGTALLIPALYVRFAQSPIAKAVASTRYKRRKALRGFRSWWKTYHRCVAESDQLGIVYGHTHLLDWIEIEQWSSDSPTPTRTEAISTHSPLKFKNRPKDLHNLSSWLAPKRGRKRHVTWGTFFYADEEGALLLGWDMVNRRAFHIPNEFIRKRREHQPLEPSEIHAAQNLGWPPQFIEKWHTPMNYI
jgi:hypothetical protein